jgi:pimeloyl-ACP methyl ester carboxylesterase
MPRTRAGEIELNYDVRGSGEPLLLIMGFGGSSAGWRSEFLDGLARSFRVITFDNRGTGQSDKPETPTTIPQMADDAAALLDALGIERAHVIGISMGGMIAQEMALRHPTKINGLVLGCTNCGRPAAVTAAPEVVGLLAFPPEMDPREAARRARPASYTPEFITANDAFLEEMLERAFQNPTPPATRLRQMEAIQSWGACDRLDQLTMPVLIVTGDRDVLVPPENSRILQERIAGSRLHVIPDAAHVFFNSHPKESVQVVTEFLQSVSAPSAAGAV